MDQIWIIALLSFILIIFITVVLLILTKTNAYPEIKEYRSEGYFLDVSSGKEKAFPSYTDPPTCKLSVIVPAYNEEERLPPMLDEALGYLEERFKQNAFYYEVIIVDDGSSDSTTKVGLRYTEKYGSDKVKVLTLAENRGKGGAVRLGMMRARGELLLFADADGATKFSDFDKLEAALRKVSKNEDIGNFFGIICGSRSHLEEESIAKRSMFRTLLMYGFHFVVWFFTVRGIKDTQCGFKLLTRRTAQSVFDSLHIERWAFDVEMLFIAQKLGFHIQEVAVTWTEIDGSKVTPIISWIQMGRDIVLIWLRYTLGLWRIKGDHRR